MNKNMNSMQDRMDKQFAHRKAVDVRRMFEIELDKIELNPDQPRKSFNEETLQELAKSIGKHGQLQPVVLKKNEGSDTYILAAGERRYRAHQLLNKAHIHAILTDGQLDEIAIIENVQREDLKPFEEAQGYKRLIDTLGYSHDQVADVVGKGRTTITGILQLNNLPQTIQEECLTSDIPKSILIEIAQINNPLKQQSLWEKVRNGGLTVKEFRAQRKSDTDNVERPKQSPVSQAVSAARALVRRLEAIEANDIAENRDSYEELIKIRDQIDHILDNATAERR